MSVADVLFVLLGLVAFAAGWHAAEFVPVDRGGLAAACFLVATGGSAWWRPVRSAGPTGR